MVRPIEVALACLLDGHGSNVSLVLCALAEALRIAIAVSTGFWVRVWGERKMRVRSWTLG